MPPWLVPQISLVVGDLVPVQKRPVFLLEGLEAVIFALLAKVVLHFTELGLADRESGVTQITFLLAGCAVGVGLIPRPRSRCVSGGEPTTGWPPGTTPGRYEKGY